VTTQGKQAERLPGRTARTLIFDTGQHSFIMVEFN
jgi:hypothetical protein